MIQYNHNKGAEDMKYADLNWKSAYFLLKYMQIGGESYEQSSREDKQY